MKADDLSIDVRVNVEKEGLLFRAMDCSVELSRRAARAEGEAEDDRIPIAISSEAPCPRMDWWKGETYQEILGHSADEINLSYARDGLPFLVDHETRDMVGIVEDITVNEDKKIRGRVRFSRSARAQEIKQDMLDGIRKKISVGYRQSEEYDQTEDNGAKVRRYKNWTPMEASSVPIPADYEVGVGRSAARAADGNRNLPGAAPKAKENTVKEGDTAARENGSAPTDVRVQTLSEERGRVSEITALCEEHGFNAKRSEWINSGASISDVRKEILSGVRERLAKPTQSGAPIVDLSEKEVRRYSFARAILGQAGVVGVDDGFEREVEREIEKKLPSEYKRRGGVLIPTQLTTRAGLDATNATKGPELKFTQAGEFIDLLRARMVLRQMGARVLSGLTGPVSFPRATAAATAAWMGENSGADVAESNLLLDTVTLAIKTLMASTSFSRQLLVSALSSSVDAEQMVREDLAKVHALELDRAGINGSGAANQPRGILNVVGIGSVAGGANGAAPTYAHVVDLETEVATDNADIGSLAYLSNAKVRGKLRKTETFAGSNGKPVWDGGIEGEVNGYKAFATTQVPSNLTKGTSVGVASAIIFGNFDEAIYGEWGALELVVDPYRLKKQGMIEVTSFQMADFVVRHPESFAAMVDALTA